MEIHELNTFSGTLGSGNWLATDNGTDTSKVSAQAIIDAAVGDVNPMLLGNGYGTCSTSSTSADSTRYVTLSGYELVKGGIIAVRFTYDVPSGSYLNVNSKGAKRIYFHGNTLPSGLISAGDTAFFMYDGTYYRLLGVDNSQSAFVDYITEYDYSSSWRYRKWKNGFVEAWRPLVNFGSVTPTAWVSPVRYYNMTPISIPSGIFTSSPTVMAQCLNHQWWTVFIAASSATSIDSGRFATVASSATTLQIAIYAFGS